MSKKKKEKEGIVYSTDPNFTFREEQKEEVSIPAAAQKLRVMLETKHRGGKAVTVVYGYVGKIEELGSLGKQLKSYCGTGGSVKDGEILIQGDQREKVLQWFLKNGYKGTKRV